MNKNEKNLIEEYKVLAPKLYNKIISIKLFLVKYLNFDKKRFSSQ